MDRLSKLPEGVLNKILCFLPQKQAVRTCLLSKSWRYHGPTRSLLELSQIDVFRSYNNVQKFVSVLDNSLQRYRDQNLLLKQLILKMYSCTSFHCVIASIAFKAEFLVELCLVGCDMTITFINFTPKLSLKNLRKLSVLRVVTSDHNLQMLLSRSCFPLVQYLNLDFTISVKVGNSAKMISIATDLPTLETISITNKDGWYFHNGAYFPRLKYLNIQHTLLSADSFAFFASNYMPSLEEFHLSDCKGLEEFHLSNPSIKYLHISGMTELIKATIDAPNLVYFKFSVPVLLPIPSISFAPISSEWKSNIDLGFFQYTYSEAVNELLKALRQSRITLQFVDHYLDLMEGPVTSICPNKPLIAVEHFHLSGSYSYSDVRVLFNSWFRSFRPRHIYDVYNKGIIVFEIIWKVLVHDIKSSWHQDLVEVIVETSYGNKKEWHPFHGNSFSKTALASNQRVRLRLKWRD